MGIEQPGERDTGSLPHGRFHKEIIVEGEEHAVEGGRAVKQLGIGTSLTAIFLGRQNINAPKPESKGDRAGNMGIHVQGDRH